MANIKKNNATQFVCKSDCTQIQRTGFKTLVAAVAAIHPALAAIATKHQSLFISTAIKAGLQHEDEAFAVLFDRWPKALERFDQSKGTLDAWIRTDFRSALLQHRDACHGPRSESMDTDVAQQFEHDATITDEQILERIAEDEIEDAELARAHPIVKMIFQKKSLEEIVQAVPDLRARGEEAGLHKLQKMVKKMTEEATGRRINVLRGEGLTDRQIERQLGVSIAKAGDLTPAPFCQSQHRDDILAREKAAAAKKTGRSAAVKKLWIDRGIVRNTSPQRGFDGFGMGA
ncbi:MAG: hypothetical protein V4563_05055 [Pseudomonadota bacterium]